jgi:2-(1,2-epoxy-1,2-dihydrophenyl)acetyl-CoA isomerase
MPQDLLTEIDGPIARITFNRPQARNAMSPAMVEPMKAFLAEVAGNDHVRCVIMTGAGEHFMAGGDVSGFSEVVTQTPEQRRAGFIERLNNAAPIFQYLLNMPQPVITGVRGACAGAAVGFAACSDFILAGKSAYFLVAHVHIGVSPDCATTYALTRRVGVPKAMEMAVLGGKVSSSEALAIGLVNRVVQDSQLETETHALAEQICHLPSRSVRHIKQLMNRSLGNTLDEQLKLEAESVADCAASPDFVEGVTAFLEKRKAEFNRR